MEAEQHKELEMDEDTSKVYDIIHPTPVPLKQLSAIVISLEIWRRKINEYRTGRKLKNFYPSELRIKYSWIKQVLPDLPSTIYKTIEEFFSRFRHSMEYWLKHHFDRGFCYQYADENYVLKDFDYFVCDYDGSIHYVRTAERMMRCEGFNSEMKFIIACMYFFEDDIRRIWPSVSNNVNIDFIRFHECPQLYYWICLLTNQLDKIETWGNETVEENMLRAWMPYNRPSVEYFWNRMPIEEQMRIPVGIGALSNSDFVRYILPKMDDHQLDKFLNDSWDGDNLYDLFLYLHCDEWVVLRTWFHIRNIIKESNFSNCVVRMFEIVYNHDVPEDRYELVKWNEFHEQEKWEYLCCQIWKHTPFNLKQSAIRRISSDDTWFDEMSDSMNFSGNVDSNEIHVEFLLLILQDASLKERISFWHNCWRTLIEVVRTEDLQRMVQLCLKNDDEITYFKQNVMIISRDFFQFCVKLLDGAFFEKLNGLVSFCCAESQAARNLKQRILQSVFLDGDFEFHVISGIVKRSRYFNEFVNDAFDSVDASTDFKNLLMSSSSIMKHLSSIICESPVSSKKLIKFINSVVSTEEALTQSKIRLIDSLKEYVTTNADVRDYIFAKHEFNSLLLWCLLGSDERVEEFKLSCIP